MTSELIVFPDIEGGLIDYLNDALAWAVHGPIPNPRPARFTRVIRTGGPRATLVTDGAQVTIESWGVTETQSAGDAQTVRAHVNALRGEQVAGATVYLVEELSGPGNLPDPDSAQARYVQSFRIHVRGAAA
jgi:hypothetical protein